jgi:hypothetical protein
MSDAKKTAGGKVTGAAQPFQKHSMPTGHLLRPAPPQTGGSSQGGGQSSGGGTGSSGGSDSGNNGASKS